MSLLLKKKGATFIIDEGAGRSPAPEFGDVPMIDDALGKTVIKATHYPEGNTGPSIKIDLSEGYNVWIYPNEELSESTSELLVLIAADINKIEEGQQLTTVLKIIFDSSERI